MTESKSEFPRPEFSRSVSADRMPQGGVEQHLEAKPAERQALAARFDLPELQKLTADLSLKPGRQHSLELTGKVQAELVQRCIITLELLPKKLSFDMRILCLPDSLRQDGAGPGEVEDTDEDIEFYTGGRIDLGELVAQQLGVSIDPYPRKIDARLEAAAVGPREQKAKPLAGLAVLASKPEK